MADYEKMAAKRALNISAFSRLKDLVRELEDNEKQHGQDFTNAEVEFKLNPGALAWFVAYRTVAANLSPAAQLSAARQTQEEG